MGNCHTSGAIEKHNLVQLEDDHWKCCSLSRIVSTCKPDRKCVSAEGLEGFRFAATPAARGSGACECYRG